LPVGTFSVVTPAFRVLHVRGFQFVWKILPEKMSSFLANAEQIPGGRRKRPEIGLVTSTFIPSVPEEYINVHRDKVLKQEGCAIKRCVPRPFKRLWRPVR